MTLFGRAALALGYAASPAAFATTQDVDAILPLLWLAAKDQNLDFWQAQQRTNAELEPAGLYITHLFRELEVILTPDWLTRRVTIRLELARLKVFRPATLDLILTKMARGDENDLADIRFLLRQEPLDTGQLQAAFARARRARNPRTLPRRPAQTAGLGRRWLSQSRFPLNRPPGTFSPLGEKAGMRGGARVADIPKFDILCGVFPCQPFSLAGVSKKNSLGRLHGFQDVKQGDRFFSIADILDHHQRPPSCWRT